MTEKAGKTANMADLLISLDFEGKTVGLTASSLHKSTIARFFNVHEDGLHLKVSRNGKTENIWPLSNGKFLLPHGITNATVIAFSAEEYQDEEDFAPSTFGFRYVLSNFVGVAFVVLSFRASSSSFMCKVIKHWRLTFYEKHSVKFSAPNFWDVHVNWSFEGSLLP